MATNTQDVILEFPEKFINMTVKSEFEGYNEDGDPVVYRLIQGTTEIEKDKQKTQNPRPVFIKIAWTRQTFKKHEAEFILKKGWEGVKVYDPEAEHKANIDAVARVHALSARVLEFNSLQTKIVGFQLYGGDALKDVENSAKLKIIALANEYVERVESVVNKSENNDRVIAATAIVLGSIYEADAGNSVKFKDTNELVTSVRKGENVLDALEEHFKTPEGKEHKKRIGLLIAEHNKPAEKPATAKK